MKITTTLLKQIIKEELAELGEASDRSGTRMAITAEYETDDAAAAALAKAKKDDPNHFENRDYKVVAKTTTVYKIVKK